MEISDVRELLRMPANAVIISHRNPDGDAIGSSLAMKHYLEDNGHSATIILPSDYPPVFGYLEDINKIKVFDMDKQLCLDTIKESDLIFLLDFNSLDRIDDMGLTVQDSKAPKIMIDHHLDPEPVADFLLSDHRASSTAELVYVFLEMLGEENKITPDIAQALFTGILTDTHSFKFGTSPRLFRIAGALKEFGVDDYWLQNRIFNSLSIKQLKLIGHCIANRMELLPEHRTGIMYLSAEDYQNFKISRGDTEGIVNYVLMMRSMRIAVLITEQSNAIKLSFRSKGNISVQELAREYFNGGGHKNASGGSCKKTLHETIDYFKEILPGYLDKKGYFVKQVA